MTNKYNMSVENNILYAKRNIVDSIWKEANIEGIAVTFPDTREIFEGRTVPGMSVNDTVAINNLKHGWQFILDTINSAVDIPYIQKVNAVVSAGLVLNPGQPRMTDVMIGGTSWKPDIPDYDTANAVIDEINQEKPGQERALKMFAALCRSQLFYDGNKRTAQLVVNKMLIADGAGILAIPVQDKREFDYLLVDFYESGVSDKLLAFLDEKAIDGTTIPGGQNREIEPLKQVAKAACDMAHNSGINDKEAAQKNVQER